MSKQIQFTKTGSPDVLQIVDVAVPAPKAHEVQIQIHAIGLNRAEMMYREGANKSLNTCFVNHLPHKKPTLY